MIRSDIDIAITENEELLLIVYVKKSPIVVHQSMFLVSYQNKRIFASQGIQAVYKTESM